MSDAPGRVDASTAPPFVRRSGGGPDPAQRRGSSDTRPRGADDRRPHLQGDRAGRPRALAGGAAAACLGGTGPGAAAADQARRLRGAGVGSVESLRDRRARGRQRPPRPRPAGARAPRRRALRRAPRSQPAVVADRCRPAQQRRRGADLADPPRPRRWHRRDAAGPLDSLGRALRRPAEPARRELRRSPPRTTSTGAGAILRGSSPREFADTIRDSPFDGEIGRRRTVAFAAVPLAPLHDAAKRLCGATVNDAVLTVVAGGLRRWLEHHHGSLSTVRFRVPVSLHSEGDRAANQDSFFTLPVHVAEPDPVARLRAIHAAAAERKADHDAERLESMVESLRSQVPLLAGFAEKLQRSPRSFAICVSNVPGPSGAGLGAGRAGAARCIPSPRSAAGTACGWPSSRSRARSASASARTRRSPGTWPRWRRGPRPRPRR